MKKQILYPLLLVFLLSACNTQQVYITGSWFNKENAQSHKYKKIYFVAMFNDVIKNAMVEEDLSKQAKKRGFDAAMNQVNLPSGFVNKDVAKEAILQKAKELGCEAVFTIAIMDVKSESHYVAGQTNYSPGTSYGYYNSFPNYYDNRYDTYQTPGYYENNRTYYLESNIFDLNELKLVGSMQSQTYNPTDLKMLSEAYAKEIFKLLDSEGFSKTKKK